MSTELKRFEIVSHSRGMESWDALEERADGDYVLFTDYEKAAKVRDEWCAEYVKCRNTLLKIREAVEGSADGAPDATDHDKLCNEIAGMIHEVIADDDENRNDA